MEIDIDDLLQESESISDQEFLRRVTTDDTPDTAEEDTPEVSESKTESISELVGRLKMWHERCRDLFVDLRMIVYEISDEDSWIEFKDKSYYGSKLYFKTDPQKPKDPKIIYATKQLCKIIGIPYSFFAACRPSLKMNIVKTWQAGLADDTKKSQNVLKIRESKDCSIIRAVTPTSKSIIPLCDLIQIIQETLTVPYNLDCVYGDEKDDLCLHARFLFEKEYTFNGPVNLGFSVTASEIDACPLSIDVLLYNKVNKTYCIANYGAGAFFLSDYTGLQPSSIRDIIPAMLNRLEEEVQEIFSRLRKKQEEATDFCAETDALDICKAKGLTSKIRKAIYHQVSELIESIKSPWDLAMHVGLVAKDFEFQKRIAVERAIGNYLNLFFSEGAGSK